MSHHWSSLASYGDVMHALRSGATLDSEEFVQGPLKRLFELALDERDALRVRARVLEYARHATNEFATRLSTPTAASALLEAAHAAFASVFGRRGPQNGWAFDVFEGRVTHNTVYR